VKVAAVQQADVKNLFNLCLFEPGIFIIWKEILAAFDVKPETMRIYMRNFNR